ncbi:MAG: c-type cytochrome biogenesis protein CcsB [Bacteroidales bacterium]
MAGLLKAVTVDRAEQETGKNALLFHLFAGDKPVSVTLWENTSDYYSTAKTEINGKKVELFYGSSVINLPFELKLNDFILERYPGSSSPSGYKSDVLLTDKAAGVEKPFMIFMNNILKYKGYRFYQSSFDRDEKGTVLSVNHDKAGMTVTYTGYLLMMLFIILSMINKNSLLRNITPGYWTSAIRKGLPVVIFLVLFLLPREAFSQKLVADRKVADEFGKILVQDQKGRTKPLFTMSSDILRKVARENEYNGLSPMQVYLGLYLDFEHWQNEPLIRISNSDLAKKLGISGNMAAFSDLVDFKNGGAYKLQEDVQKVYAKAPGDRNKTDKEIMKVDERLNIVYMIYTGEFSRFFPLKDKSMHWANYSDAVKGAISFEDSTYLSNVIPSFAESLSTNNTRTGMQIAGSVREYQERFSEYSLPSKTRVNAEVFYYKAKIFERLFPFYATVGLVLIILLIVYIISDKGNDSIILRILRYLVFAGFIFHTIGLAIRWYIAGHSPMSNGYESMLFISWVMLLVGVIFSKKSPFAVPATAFLGSMTLMVAHLSFMDPEITNLVPVLKSYWLTMHVSVITGSYAFLGFGAVIGLIVMILIALSDNKNIARISSTIDELTVLNYQTLTLGLYFLTIGTFLGAVWANESWGRYWGWDPKETWSLITIIIYSIVIHSRLIPGLKDIYTFNLLSLFAFSSVLMTYFGVNYYLSGLHSYRG